jgi:acyl-coenzyme A thioesterase PaaI-like protein
MTQKREESPAFQDSLPNIHCFGCGPNNEQGLRIKSRWCGPAESICRFTPAPHHSAGSRHYLNGGIIATLIDCHCVCTAMADAYQRERRDIGTGEEIVYVTGSLSVKYRHPVPIGETVTLRATVRDTTEAKTVLNCALLAAGERCAEGEVVAVRVPVSWRE